MQFLRAAAEKTPASEGQFVGSTTTAHVSDQKSLSVGDLLKEKVQPGQHTQRCSVS